MAVVSQDFDDLDVDVANKADGRVLVFRSASGNHEYEDQAGGGGGTKRYIQARASSTVNITGTEVTMDLALIDEQSAGDFSLASDQVTILNAGTYSIRAQVTTDDIDTAGGARCATEVRVQKNGSDIPGAYLRQYHRETTENSGCLECLHTFAANDVVRVRLLQLSGSTNVRTVAEGCRLILELIS